MKLKSVKSISLKNWILIVVFLVISVWLYFCFHNDQIEFNFRYIEDWSTLAFLILGFLIIILDRQSLIKEVMIKVTIVFILLAIVMIVYGHGIGLSYMYSTALTKAQIYENVSPFLIPLCALAYALPYLIIVPLYLREEIIKSTILKYILLIPLLFTVMLSSIILNAIVFFGLLDYCSTQVWY